MELILLHEHYKNYSPEELGFNPCFIGTYSFTNIFLFLHVLINYVLILVLLELILLPVLGYREEVQDSLSFNPCFIGTYSFTGLQWMMIKGEM